MIIIKNIWKLIKPYHEPKVIGMFFLGFSSGLPFLLLLSTLSIWLQKEGISKTTVGIFSFTTIPYALKFFIAPFIDHWNIPIFKSLGHRKSWLIVTQIGLIISILGLGFSNPSNNLILTALWAITIALFSSIQDIVYEAYRAELLTGQLAGYGIGASVLGYRTGMLVSSAGAIYLEVYFGWKFAYSIMACFMFIGMISSILSLQTKTSYQNHYYNNQKKTSSFYLSIIAPFKKFLHKQNITCISSFIITYKFGDTVLNVMTNPFLLEIGFSEIEIAHVAKSFGTIAMMLGSLLGGILLAHRSLHNNLLLCAGAHTICSLIFLLQSLIGYDFYFFCLNMGIQNLICGLSQTTLIYYLTQFCHKPFTATHYAILSSFGSGIRIILSSASGWFADHVTWECFYSYVTIGCIPCILLLCIFSNKILSQNKKI